MGFLQKYSATILLALLGLGSILGVNGRWLFGAMEEREEDYRRAMQPRQFVQCSAGSTACGALGCIGTRRCCNAGAAWGCLAGNECYTVDGYVDCYSTTMLMPTISRKCYDFGQSGCTGGQPCFTWYTNPPFLFEIAILTIPIISRSSSGFCATEVLADGGGTWLECATKVTIVTVTAAAETTGSDGSDPTPTDNASITPPTGVIGTSTPIPTDNPSITPPTNVTETSTPIITGTTTGIPCEDGGGSVYSTS
ncbi:hypothetical protein B9Z19DRAFT_1127656 [Tuber borchii]|uniref:Uncharacterized protein n=1 Tax=Tuber borchii TaxID=42251 RepID=A0A2T6ZQX4_TUBBO|nr:hypothetical protein B9Z19DRAFT_1127656 [Tuber borchii]